MNRLCLCLALLALPTLATAQDARLARRAQNVTIIRDTWGIAHVYGRTDADAVFGYVYAQAEDDFNRVETNFINAMGRLAEAQGESAVFQDLRMKLFIHPDSLKAKYAASPAWLRTLMDAWADGLNYYLQTHSDVKPRVITRFEPWMALSFSEGSIGGDIETISIADLRAFYGGDSARPRSSPDAGDDEPRGSNGIAIAPKLTANGRALLLINPHTSFFFRSEGQMVSEEGLNAYGATTWGQFFIYQGFNDRTGWMHTSSSVDAIDEYLETVVKRGDRWFYRHGAEERPVVTQTVRVPYRTATGMASREFTVFRTHHGPVIRAQDGKWVTVRLMEDPVKALQQSWLRTKARTLADFRMTMDLHTNSSNNTIYADADGNIAYFHANFVPRRDTAFDWGAPVDGSNPATEWAAPLSVDESPLALNPAVGWVYNANDWPWMAAGPDSPRPESFPAYVDRGRPSARGRHAVRVLEGKSGFTIETLRAAAYDDYLVAFDDYLPPLFRAFEVLPGTDPRRRKLAAQIDVLRAWDRRWSTGSVATSLAIFFAEALGPRPPLNAVPLGTAASASADEFLRALDSASERLTRDFGTWKTPWGDINRFQRLTGDIVHPFRDDAPSIPVAFPSARWGSLASFGASPKPGTKKWYGTSGNSFVAVVEFGRDSVRAIAVTAGGQSGRPGSPHFNDQAQRYATGDLRPVWFYRHQVEANKEREYRPGR